MSKGRTSRPTLSFLFLAGILTLMLTFAGSAGHADTSSDAGQTRCNDNGTEIPCPQPAKLLYSKNVSCPSVRLTCKDNENGTVTDLNTGLTWQKGDDQNTQYRTWHQAMNYCSGLDLGGHSNWRLPTRLELLSIIDHGMNNPSINTDYFPNCRSDYYWSCTTDSYFPESVWVVSSNGYAYWQYKARNAYVRCVCGGS